MKLLTQKDVTNMTGINKNTLASWRRAQTGPAFIKSAGKNGAVFYTKEAIDKWIISRGVETTTQIKN
jgi:hypothetical protein